MQWLYPIKRMVNVRNEGRAFLSDLSDNLSMSDTVDIAAIKGRLAEKLDEAGISMRAASINSGFGQGYVQNLLSSDTEPVITKLAVVCEKNGISFSYVLLGLEVSPQTRRLLDLIQKNPEKLNSLLILLGEPLTPVDA